MSHSFLMLEQTHCKSFFQLSRSHSHALLHCHWSVCNLLFKTKLKILSSDISVYIKVKKLLTTNISLYRVFFYLSLYGIYKRLCPAFKYQFEAFFPSYTCCLLLLLFRCFFMHSVEFWFFFYNLFHIIKSMYKLYFVHNQVYKHKLIN